LAKNNLHNAKFRFNLCQEPLLQAVTKECEGRGAILGIVGNRIAFIVQAHVEDIIFISKEANGVGSMLEVLETFIHSSRMEANMKKYATASYLNDVYEHRCNLSENWKLTNQAIPNLTSGHSLKYLGTAVAPRRRVRLEAVEAKLTELKA
jgi:hypothetical protein